MESKEKKGEGSGGGGGAAAAAGGDVELCVHGGVEKVKEKK